MVLELQVLELVVLEVVLEVMVLEVVVLELVLEVPLLLTGVCCSVQSVCRSCDRQTDRLLYLSLLEVRKGN